MPDFASRELRRRIMQAVGREDTSAERLFERFLEPLGIAYTRHAQALPGKPDFYFPSVPLAVFVHGCFWHGHKGCRRRLRAPGTHRKYWIEKIRKNRSRDRRAARQLRSMGIAVYTVWECHLRSGRVPSRLLRRLDTKQNGAR